MTELFREAGPVESVEAREDMVDRVPADRIEDRL